MAEQRVDEPRRRVTVTYVGLAPRLAGVREETVELDGEHATLRDLLSLLGDRHGIALEERLLGADGRLANLAAVLVNGQSCHGLDSLETPLGTREHVEVVLFGPPPQGG
jgi:hypothetical protein